MAYSCPRDLDGFAPLLSKPDTLLRQQLGQDLLNFLAEPANPISCEDIGQFIESLVPWTNNSNYKVASLGIEILTFLIDRLGHDFRPYLQTVLPATIDRLGDAKDAVREKSQLLILKLLERNVLTPQTLFEKLTPGFTHKNAKIREEVLRCLVNTLNEHGAHSLTLSKFIPDIVRLLSDPTSSVRDTASATLVDLYRHVGEKLRMDIQKRNLVPQAKWQLLSSRFDEVRNRGELLPTASKTIEPSFDEVDRLQRTPAPVKMSSASTVKSKPNSANANSAGAVDEELFLRSFEDVPNMQIFSPRDVTDTMKTIYATISDSSKDWNKRVEALKKMRSLVMAGATHYEDFYVELKRFDIALQASIKDLRSQVVRETCITIAYLSQTLEAKFDKMAEMLLHHLIMLIQNSAKIMATSGEVAVKFIIKHIPNPRLIPIITNNATTSKSKEIRRACCEFIESMLALWPSHSLERHVVLLQEAIKKGVADADPEARVLSRKAFHRLRDHFPDHAESLLQSLEPSYRRALQGGETMSSSCSNSNLNSCFKSSRMYAKPTGVQSASGSTENLASTGGGLHRAPSLPRSYRQRSGIPVLSRADNTPGRNGFRSNSAIDLQAAQRAKARAQYSAMARNKIQSGTASLQGEVFQSARPKRTVETLVNPSPERVSRTRNRNSQSQPTSRSGSPSSRLAYLYNRSTDHDSPRPRRTSSGIPRSSQGSRDTSRETSPNRSTGISRFRRGADRPPLSPASRPVLAQKILQQSREAENALADAFNDSSESQYRAAGRKSMRSIDNHSDESETSSICSERSFDSYKRQSDSYSWSGSQQRLTSRDLWEPCRDINEIIVLCASTTWQERRDGLLSLQSYLAQDVKLTDGELKHLTEIFAKMFTDAHTKGMALFLDTLQEVIKMHKDDLEYWIYVLLQRVFMKIGGETLNSIASKLISTLELVRVCFGVDQLIPNVYRFLLDATQTPNVKSKTVMLNFLTSLCSQPDAAAAIVAPSNALQALQKIIAHSQDAKSMEIRQAAKVCIVALWNCDTAAVTLLLTELPKEQQDIASNIVHNHMRKTSTGSEPGSPMVPSSPKPPQSPSTPPFGDQEEVYKSLRRTTAEIQNYSFETLGPKLDGDRDTTSQDSGISQMSAGNDMRNDIAAIEEKMEDLNSRQFGLQSGSRSLPFAGLNGISETDSNGCRSLGDIKDSDAVVRDVIERCCIDHTTSVADKRKLLTQVLDLVHQGHVQGVMENFKKLLRIFIDHLAAGDTQNRILSLKIIAAIFQNSSLKCVWEKYVELITLKVLNAHSDEKREVIKEAETTAAAMARCVSPFDTVVYTLAPLIRTSPYPEDLGALKMLTKLVEANPEQITDQHLKEIMPGILKGTDHNESPVRKSSIFCMVALYKAVGEERLADYISGLTGSKVRLLRLYITRAEQQTTPNDTPKNAS
ncbi:CLIP-associating protein 1-A isoform X3 [Dendroctonus ponderosae]|uniref:CLIP-associating protein 1-A isoform X3 n=1 Tax=Dendroctonus ponderosae TaxID=77166 RepID=UPI0020364344|nr:CLIP-associating protein 1-A isoform X3 [Dendroctonus ponderosae]